VGGALIALGYDRDFADVLASADVHDSAPAASSLPRASIPGWRTVHVDRDAGTIRVPAGVTLDLGATAKALAADRAAAAACAAAGCGVLVSFGGDLALVGTGPVGGWRVRVTDDHRADVTATGQWISLRSGGLATSSVAVRRWQTASGVVHHLVDPRSGGSAESVWRTVSVTAASCLDANIASTAAIIRDTAAVAWLTELGLPSRLVGADGSVRHVAGWPTSGDDLPSSDSSSVAVA
jgi:thiamine biosynthesis lipoprotein